MPPNAQSILSLPFTERAEILNTPPLASYLLSLISIKRSNLCVSADVHTTYDLLQLAEEVGDYICVLKTHADIIDDFSKNTIKGLQEISRRKHFLLFEDRKFGDIGNTLQLQYTRGPLQIATWAHLTNAHLLPGPSMIPALASAAQSALTSLNQSVATIITTGSPLPFSDDPKPSTSTDHSTGSSQNPNDHLIFSHTRARGNSATATTTISQSYESTSPPAPPSLIKSLSGEDSPPPSSSNREAAFAALGPPPHARGLLLLAEMSSSGNLLTAEYTAACVKAARANKDFVLGYVAQHSLNTAAGDAFISFAPGVGLPAEGETEDEKRRGDGKGQVWRSPREVVGRDGVDVIIVGRGILGAEDRAGEAERYRGVAWRAYEERIGRRGV